MDDNTSMETDIFGPVRTNADGEVDMKSELQFRRKVIAECNAIQRRKKNEELNGLFVLEEDYASPRSSLVIKRDAFIRGLLELDLQVMVATMTDRMPTPKQQKIIKKIAVAKLRALKRATRPRHDCYDKFDDLAVDLYHEIKSNLKDLEKLIAQSADGKPVAT